MENQNWVLSLDEKQKEKVFEVMRFIDKKINQLYEAEAKLRPSYGSIAVGAAQFEPFLEAETLREFLMSLRKGDTPEESKEKALKYSRECIEKHNAKSKDINWKRWEGAGDSKIEWMYSMVQNTLKETNNVEV